LKTLAYLTGFILLCCLPARAQPDSCTLRISLLTCSPGEELYSSFGHTAVRVRDAAGTDMVFNYGTFQYSPEFYSQFIRGKLLYSLSVEEFSDFLYSYQYESRSVVEQEVLFGCAEKQALFRALLQNAQEQNRYYRYDFLFDNCTTRAGDIIAANAGDTVMFRNILPARTPTFRNLLHTYLDRGGQHWSKLGIDILLGSRLDRKVTNRQAMFLPDYLLKGFDSATVDGRPLVSRPIPLLQMPSPLDAGSLFRPAVVFGVLLAMVAALSFVRRSWAEKSMIAFDVVFFFLLGLAGLLLLFMWFGTDHVVCRDNLNLLWALPTHVVMAFFALRRGDFARKYFFAVFLLTAVLLLAWFFLPQQMNNSLLPLVGIILLRSWFIGKAASFKPQAAS
jgi:hypothetical protein